MWGSERGNSPSSGRLRCSVDDIQARLVGIWSASGQHLATRACITWGQIQDKYGWARSEVVGWMPICIQGCVLILG